MKRNLFIFWERYIRNPDIFRTLAYSEHCQRSIMERFAKIAT